MGKFDAKNKQSGVDVYTLLEQRKQQSRPTGRSQAHPGSAAPRQAGNAAPAQSRNAPTRPAQAAPGRPMPIYDNAAGAPSSTRRAPAPVAAPVPEKKRKGIRKGTLIFYTCCMAFVFVFYLATFLGMNALRNWLVSYESAQPKVKSQEVFQELFVPADWSRLYSLAGLESSGFEGSESFVSYMENKVAGQELSFMETSAGLSGDKKYVVRAGDERIAVFTLEDRNHAEAKTDVPDWQLKGVEFYLAHSESVRIVVEEGSTVTVNGVLLDENSVILIRDPKANEYLPTFAPAPRQQVLQVSGLMTQPVVEIRDPNGQEIDVTYDEETATYTAIPAAQEIPEDRYNLALKTVQTYAMYMSGKASAGELSKYFDRNSEAYQTILDADLNWVQKGSNYAFADESVTEYRVYSPDIFSVRVSTNLQITRSEDGSVRDNVITQSLFFTKNSSGNWVCFVMTAVDINQYTEQVRLTFMNGEEVLSSEFVSSDASEVACPQVEAPEGKTLTGWTVEETDENGRSVLRLVFTPDENGIASVPSGAPLAPMTLKPLFE